MLQEAKLEGRLQCHLLWSWSLHQWKKWILLLWSTEWKWHRYKHESLQFYDEEASRWRTCSSRKWQQVHKWTMYVNKVENTPCCYWSWFKYAMKRGVASPPTSKSARPKPIRRNVEHFRRLRLRKIQMIRISSFLTWLRYSFQPNCDSTRRKKLITKKNNYNSNDDESH